MHRIPHSDISQTIHVFMEYMPTMTPPNHPNVGTLMVWVFVCNGSNCKEHQRELDEHLRGLKRTCHQCTKCSVCLWQMGLNRHKPNKPLYSNFRMRYPQGFSRTSQFERVVVIAFHMYVLMYVNVLMSALEHISHAHALPENPMPNACWRFISRIFSFMARRKDERKRKEQSTRIIQWVSNRLPYPTYRSPLGTRWKC